MLPLGATTFLGRIHELFCEAGVDTIIAVVGDETKRALVDATSPVTLRLVINPDPGRGMLSSVLAGLDEAERLGARAALIHPVDHPLVAPATISAVLAALRQGARLAIPSVDGRRGHPGGFARPTWPALRSAAPERGARAVLANHPDWIVHVPGDPACIAGIDTSEDYERWIGPLPTEPPR